MLAAYGAGPLERRRTSPAWSDAARATLVKRVMTAAGVDAPLDEALARFLAAYDERLTHHTRPYDGIPDAARRACSRAGMAMALLTNKPLEQSVRILDAFGLAKYFQWIVGGDGPWPRKPAPDGMQVPDAAGGRGPADTVLIGDSTDRSADVAQCRRAHLPCALWVRVRRSCRRTTCAATNRSSIRRPRFPECCMEVDSAGWSGEGAFTQVVVDRLRAIDEVAAPESRRCAGDALGSRLQLHRERDLRDVRHRGASTSRSSLLGMFTRRGGH